jgi:hypothetical protein
MMIRQATSVNISLRVIENICTKLNIELKEYHKSIITILIPSLIYRDGTIVILSETIHQINRIIKKHNDKIDFVSILLGYNCITSIDKYGAITIPLSFFLSKLTINREIINDKSDKLSKKVLTNATQTLCVSEVLSYLGIPKMISVPIINIILELFYMDIDKEKQMMINANVAFKNHKMSEISKVLKQMQFEKIFLSTAILMIITHIGLNINASLIFVTVLNELCELIKSEYKKTAIKGFLK